MEKTRIAEQTNRSKNLRKQSSLSAETDTFERIVKRFNADLLAKLSALEINDQENEAANDPQLKELAGIFKLLQGVEEMLKRIQENHDQRRESGIDALEFRRKLEAQIAKLVDEDTAE